MIGMRWDLDGRISRLLNRSIHEKTGENDKFSTNLAIIKSDPNLCRLTNFLPSLCSGNARDPINRHPVARVAGVSRAFGAPFQGRFGELTAGHGTANLGNTILGSKIVQKRDQK